MWFNRSNTSTYVIAVFLKGHWASCESVPTHSHVFHTLFVCEWATFFQLFGIQEYHEAMATVSSTPALTSAQYIALCHSLIHSRSRSNQAGHSHPNKRTNGRRITLLISLSSTVVGCSVGSVAYSLTSCVWTQVMALALKENILAQIQ